MNDLKFTTAGEVYNLRHGGPYDRGSADRYYRRPFLPHYYKGASYHSEIVRVDDMTEDEIAAYTAGFDEQNDRKEWD